MERVLIAGCGYVGSRLAELLVEEGRTVFGLKRDPSTLPPGVTGVAADVSKTATLADLPSNLDGLVYAVAPSGRSEAAYRTAYVDGLLNVLRSVPPIRLVLVSSTGVYGQQDGRWVDEATAPDPADATGRILLEGEGVAHDRQGGAVVLRLGGIYGPGRDRTIRRVLSGDAGCPDPDRYGNRIHRDDAAAALLHLLELSDPDPEPVYIGVDRDPAPLRDVYRWIADQRGAPDPCREDRPEAPDTGGRRGTNKRCSSQRLVDSGFRFRYPTFREGYGTLMDEETGGHSPGPTLA